MKVDSHLPSPVPAAVLATAPGPGHQAGLVEDDWVAPLKNLEVRQPGVGHVGVDAGVPVPARPRAAPPATVS